MPGVPAIGVVPIDQMQGEDVTDTKLLCDLRKRAESYINCFDWFPGITEMYYGAGVGGILALFLIRTYPNAFSQKGTPVDEWLWVIVGDIPSAYCVLDTARKPTEACEAYLELMSDWIRCVQGGNTLLDGVFPIPMALTADNAGILERRLALIRQHVLPVIRMIEIEHASSAIPSSQSLQH